MAKVNIEFSLPEEEQEAVAAIKSQELVAIIQDYDNWLRNIRKNRDVEKVDIDEAISKLWELTEDCGVEIF